MTPVRRVFNVDVGLGVIITAAVVWVILLIGAVWLMFWSSAAHDDLTDLQGRVRAVCQQYASLDLSGMAPLCVSVGYQQTVYVQPTGNPGFWPYLYRDGRPVQPEDLDRAT